MAPRAASRAATTGGTDKAKPRSPGLRRRELLGGAEDIQSQVQAQLAAASASASPSPETAATTRAAVAAAAGGEGSAPSVGSLSATSRFRARRELERWVCHGSLVDGFGANLVLYIAEWVASCAGAAGVSGASHPAFERFCVC